MKPPTFSITAGDRTWPGRLRVLAVKLGVTTVSAYRHNLALLQALVEFAYNDLNEAQRSLFDEIVNLYAMRSEVMAPGVSYQRQCDLVRYFRSSGRHDCATFVKQMSLVRFIALIEMARWKRAFPDEPYGANMERFELGDVIYLGNRRTD